MPTLNITFSPIQYALCTQIVNMDFHTMKVTMCGQKAKFIHIHENINNSKEFYQTIEKMKTTDKGTVKHIGVNPISEKCLIEKIERTKKGTMKHIILP